jgi:hypothetical protein
MHFNIMIGLLIVITNSRINNSRLVTDCRKRFILKLKLIFIITTEYIDAVANVVFTWDGWKMSRILGIELKVKKWRQKKVIQ